MTFALPRQTSTPAPVHNPGRTPALRKPEAAARYLAHDTRNWLTVLQMYCDLLRTPGAVSSGHQNWIDELSGAIERGQGLVASLLDSVQEASQESSAVESGLGAAPVTTAAPAVPALDLGDTLTRRLPLFERLAGDKIRVELDAAPNAGAVAIDENAFLRILHNLAGNAIEAMPRGGCLRVTLRRGMRANGNPRKEGLRNEETLRSSVAETVVLRVCDTGEGIAPERLASIFEAGVSSKPTKEEFPPRGLGLAIVRELTGQAGGRIRVRSNPGRGSCFELEFPRA